MSSCVRELQCRLFQYNPILIHIIPTITVAFLHQNLQKSPIRYQFRTFIICHSVLDVNQHRIQKWPILLSTYRLRHVVSGRLFRINQEKRESINLSQKVSSLQTPINSPTNNKQQTYPAFHHNPAPLFRKSVNKSNTPSIFVFQNNLLINPPKIIYS